MHIYKSYPTHAIATEQIRQKQVVCIVQINDDNIFLLSHLF